jgi:hypothetical protein
MPSWYFKQIVFVSGIVFAIVIFGIINNAADSPLFAEAVEAIVILIILVLIILLILDWIPVVRELLKK